MTEKKPVAAKAPKAPKTTAPDDAPALPPFPLLPHGTGPWTLADAPSDEAFIAFGPLRVPAIPTLHARLEIDPMVKRAGAVSVQIDDCRVQIQAVAGPRGGGQWHDTRRAVTNRVRSGGGTTQAVEGLFGTELVLSVPVRVNSGMVVNVVKRMVGIEGDRWMIRATVSGRSALTDETVSKTNAFLSHCAVDRGSEAISAGTVLPLAFPEGHAAVHDGGPVVSEAHANPDADGA